MKRSNGRKTKKLLWIGIPILVLLLVLLASLLYLETYYHADETAIAAFSVSRSAAERTLDNGDLVFDPGNAKIGLIFYPGGKVEHTAYVPLMRAISEKGVLCVLCKMPFRLAVFDVHAADAVRAEFPDIAHWYVGGHSLGGVIASTELSAHPGAYDGLILLGSYSTEDFSESPIRALSIYGSEDRVLNRDQYETNRKNLPENAREIVIDGGCHAYFGMYGAQKGDGIPAIANAEQIRIAAKAIATWTEEDEYAENP